MSVSLHQGDCLVTLRGMADSSVDSIVTDPPYGLSFMGKRWDYDVPSVEIWAECLRVLKPGGHLLAFAGTRTQHRMAVRIEDAGFEIRDMIAWVYGSGFPKSLDVSKAIDKAAGADREVVGVREDFAKRAGLAERPNTANAGGYANPQNAGQITTPATEAARQWQGWGTALKPALEPITMARKPLVGTVAANVLEHGAGALNIDGCRVGWPDGVAPEIGTPGWGGPAKKLTAVPGQEGETVERSAPSQLGRWPANLIHDGSDEVRATFPQAKGQQGDLTGHAKARGDGIYGGMAPARDALARIESDTSAARFFYCAKASKADREGGLAGFEVKAIGSLNMRSDAHAERTGELPKPRANTHPTVKPTDLMAYLCRLVTPPGGVVLDPFMGSGSTGKAALREGFGFIGCEMSPEYTAIARARIDAALAELYV